MKQIYNNKLILFLILILVPSITLQKVLEASYIIIDDPAYLTGNEFVRQGLNWTTFKWALTSNYFDNWAPVMWLSHLLAVSIFGLEPFGHHLINLAIHIINVILLFITLELLTKNKVNSFFVALLFSIHPLIVEPVAWISSRKDLLSLFGGLLSIYFYTWFKLREENKYYIYALVFFVFSLLSKPALIALPLILVLLDYWPLKRIANLQTLKDSFLGKKLFFVLAIVFALLSLFIHTGNKLSIMQGSLSLLTRITNACYYYFEYFQRTFFPKNLAIIYPHPYADLSYTKTLCGLFFILSLFIACSLTYKKHKEIFVGLLWFLLSIFPFLQIFSVGIQSTANRWMYFPIIGLLILIVWCLSKLKSYAYILSLIILSFALFSFNEAKQWKNSVQILEHSIANTNDNIHAHKLLGLAYQLRGQQNQANANFIQSLAANPDYFPAYEPLVKSFAKEKDYQGMIDYLGNIESTDTKYCFINYFRFRFLLEVNDYPEAIKLFQQKYKALPLDLGLKQLNAALEKCPDYKLAKYYITELRKNS